MSVSKTIFVVKYAWVDEHLKKILMNYVFNMEKA